VTITVELSIVIDRTFVLVDENLKHVSAFPLVVNVPAVTVTVPVVKRASAREHVAPALLMVGLMAPNATPFDVIV